MKSNLVAGSPVLPGGGMGHPTEKPMSKILVDAGPSERGWHGFENAARCLRYWAWGKVGGKKFAVTEPLVKGSLIHVGLAHYYQQKSVENPDDYYTPAEAITVLAQEEADKARDFNERNLWLSSVAPIIGAMDAYEHEYDSRCNWKVVAVEKELRAHIPIEKGSDDTFLFTQRADLIVEDGHGFKWIVDHKSCYRITGKTLRQFILSGQFLGYQVFGRKMYGNKFGGLILNRVKLSQPHGFDRCSLEPAPAAVSGFIRMLRQTEQRIRDYSHLTDPMDYPPVFSEQVCYGKYGQCPAFELCRWGDDNG
tara:strand:- start:2808 stop:3731 length:924 start_codon:yes stop_codon:yes gene_type:complete